MEWKAAYLDLILVPLGLSISIAYHVWLLQKLRSEPHRTFIGVNSSGRRLWVSAAMRDADKKGIVAVQTLRNEIMGSSLMATTSILLCSALAAVLSSTYSIKKPVGDAVYGAHGELTVALKYVVTLLVFLFAFLCYSLSIRFLVHAGFLITLPIPPAMSAPALEDDAAAACYWKLSPEYVCRMVEKGSALHTVGNRIFYAGLPLFLWIFGPVLVFLASATIVSVLYNLDMINEDEDEDDEESDGEKNHRRRRTIVAAARKASAASAAGTGAGAGDGVDHGHQVVRLW